MMNLSLEQIDLDSNPYSCREGDTNTSLRALAVEMILTRNANRSQTRTVFSMRIQSDLCTHAGRAKSRPNRSLVGPAS